MRVMETTTTKGASKMETTKVRITTITGESRSSGDERLHITALGEPTAHRVLDNKGKPRIELRVDGKMVHSIGGEKKIPWVRSIVVEPTDPRISGRARHTEYVWDIDSTSESEERAAQVARRKSKPDYTGTTRDVRALTVQDETKASRVES